MKKQFPIVKNIKIFGLISVLLCAVGLVSLLLLPFGTNLFNLAIDFAGGTQLEFNMHQEVTHEVAEQIAQLVEENAGVKPETPIAVGNDKDHVMIRSVSLDTEQRSAIIKAMQEKYQLTEDDIDKNDDVSASVGNDLQRKAFLSAAVAVILMLLYITFRFEFTSGLAAVSCLVHDILVMLSVYVIFQIPLNQNFIAAALTILGYSINASIIVFDRVRENLRVARKETFEEVCETSIWQTMGRTINTNLTTLFTIGMIFVLGVTALRDFTLPLMVGILAGGYSSVFLSSSLWALYRRKLRKKV